MARAATRTTDDQMITGAAPDEHGERASANARATTLYPPSTQTSAAAHDATDAPPKIRAPASAEHTHTHTCTTIAQQPTHDGKKRRSASTSHACTFRTYPMFFGIRNLRLASPASGFTGQGRWPRALRSRDLCRLDVRKAAAGPRSTGAPSPRMRRAGRAAQRDDDTARRARPCACIRRYNPEEPPIPPPPVSVVGSDYRHAESSQMASRQVGRFLAAPLGTCAVQCPGPLLGLARDLHERAQRVATLVDHRQTLTSERKKRRHC